MTDPDKRLALLKKQLREDLRLPPRDIAWLLEQATRLRAIEKKLEKKFREIADLCETVT